MQIKGALMREGWQVSIHVNHKGPKLDGSDPCRARTRLRHVRVQTLRGGSEQFTCKQPVAGPLFILEVRPNSTVAAPLSGDSHDTILRAEQLRRIGVAAREAQIENRSRGRCGVFLRRNTACGSRGGCLSPAARTASQASWISVSCPLIRRG